LEYYVHLIISKCVCFNVSQALREGNKQAQMEEAPRVPGETIKAIGKKLNTCAFVVYHKQHRTIMKHSKLNIIRYHLGQGFKYYSCHF